MLSMKGPTEPNGLIGRIKPWIAPPVFPDDDKTRRARMLNLALINILILIPVLIISNLLGGNTPITVIEVDSLVLILCLILYLWMRQGRIRLASIGLMALGFMGITAGIASLGTIRVPVTAMYLLMVITAGLLFDLGGMIVTTALCSVLVGGLIMAGNAGLLPLPNYSLTITQWVTYTAIFGWAGSLTFSALQSMHNALALANNEIAERKLTAAELAKHRDHLEELVKEGTAELEEKNYILIGEIAERKRAEEALKESETRAKALIRHAPTGIYEIDYRGPKFLSINDAMCLLSGYTREELLGMNPTELLVGDSKKLFAERIKRQLAGEEIHDEVEFNFKKKDGSIISVVLNIAFSKDKPYTALVIGHDVTERKQAEEALLESEKALRKSKDELELRVQERTADLSYAKEDLEAINEELKAVISEHEVTEKELTIAKEIAEEAVKAKSSFLANMSHEIRTPMNIVIGVTDLLLADQLTPEQKDNIELLKLNGEALLSIINDILDFSKIESDKLVLEKQPFNLRQLVEESMDLIAVNASEKNLNIAYTIDKGVPDTIIGDPGRLRQVLGNLLSNAVKFTDKGEVTLSVSSKKIDRSSEVHFAIQDTGIGIPENLMSRLFQPFNQMEPSTHRLYGGTGLGLAIAKNLVELMDGRIWVESDVGKGSVFHFTINVPSSKSEEEPMAIPPVLIGKHMLIISNNKTNRQILGRQAYDWSMIATASRSVDEALGWIQRGGQFDIAIIDAGMQGMSCLELEEEIRKYNKTLPLVFLAYLGKHVPPGHAYLAKPIKISQLYRILIEIFSIEPVQKDNQKVIAGERNQDNPLRILLAEDNASNQKITQKLLKELGYRADIAANGIEVLQALELQPYDVILMDVKMPEMDGYEASRLIRQRYPGNGPKIIAITANALEGDREKCIEAGMNDYIAKPARIQDLETALRDIGRM